MGTPGLSDLGKLCSVVDCELMDFLPSACDRCNQVFCLQHRSWTEHKCSNSDQKKATVIFCPLCGKGVLLSPNEDPNITWESHVNIDCDPSSFNHNVTNQRFCPVSACRELLTFSNSLRCRDCTQDHCLRHRFGPDHGCTGHGNPDPGFPFVGLLKKNWKTEFVHKGISNVSAQRWSSGILNVALNIRTSAGAGMQRLGSVTAQALQRAKDGMGQSSRGVGIMERCIWCPEQFVSVAALVEHVENLHERSSSGWASGADLCPLCGRAFEDPVLLVEHVERDHRGVP